MSIFLQSNGNFPEGQVLTWKGGLVIFKQGMSGSSLGNKAGQAYFNISALRSSFLSHHLVLIGWLDDTLESKQNDKWD